MTALNIILWLMIVLLVFELIMLQEKVRKHYLCIQQLLKTQSRRIDEIVNRELKK